MSDALAAAAVEVRASARVILATAPVSYGAFEVTVGRNPFVPDSDQLLAAVSAAGYAGIDLGPPAADRLSEAFASRSGAGATGQRPSERRKRRFACWSAIARSIVSRDSGMKSCSTTTQPA